MNYIAQKMINVLILNQLFLLFTSKVLKEAKGVSGKAAIRKTPDTTSLLEQDVSEIYQDRLFLVPVSVQPTKSKKHQ